MIGLRSAILTMMLGLLSAAANGQASPGQAVMSQPAARATAAAAEPRDVPENADATVDPASLLPDLPRLPARKASLIGGTVEKVDRVRDQLTIRVFGAGRMKVLFDTRTRIVRDGVAAAASDLKTGDRVYLDTILDGSTIFARNIRVKSDLTASESQGVVMNYRAEKGELLVRDMIAPEPLKLRVTPQTRILVNGQPVAADRLAAGALVALQFTPERDGRRLAHEISILAAPGAEFTFAGRVVMLDLSTGLLVLDSSTDQKTYEIHLNPSVVPLDDKLQQSSDVTVLARFDGNAYEAERVTITPPSR